MNSGSEWVFWEMSQVFVVLISKWECFSFDVKYGLHHKLGKKKFQSIFLHFLTRSPCFNVICDKSKHLFEFVFKTNSVL